MAKHTPGPWIYDEPSNWLGLSARVCTEKYEPIAQVQLSGWPKHIGRANARLCAAAPDLLAACKAIRDSRDDVWGGSPSNAAVEACLAAVAKAEGHPP